MATMTIAQVRLVRFPNPLHSWQLGNLTRVRMVFREVCNPLIGHLGHIPCVAVCVVPQGWLAILLVLKKSGPDPLNFCSSSYSPRTAGQPG